MCASASPLPTCGCTHPQTHRARALRPPLDLTTTPIACAISMTAMTTRMGGQGGTRIGWRRWFVTWTAAHGSSSLAHRGSLMRSHLAWRRSLQKCTCAFSQTAHESASSQRRGAACCPHPPPPPPQGPRPAGWSSRGRPSHLRAVVSSPPVLRWPRRHRIPNLPRGEAPVCDPYHTSPLSQLYQQVPVRWEPIPPTAYPPTAYPPVSTSTIGTGHLPMFHICCKWGCTAVTGLHWLAHTSSPPRPTTGLRSPPHHQYIVHRGAYLDRSV